MSQEVFELLSMCVDKKSPGDLAITRKDRSPVGDFRKAWRSLCMSVGLGRMVCRACGTAVTEGQCDECKSHDLKYDGLLVHDLRRTGVRNLRRLGFAEKTIMEISGHKTASVFRSSGFVVGKRSRGAGPENPHSFIAERFSERPGAVKAAPSAAKQSLDGEDRSVTLPLEGMARDSGFSHASSFTH